MGADISQFKQADLIKQLPDLNPKIDEKLPKSRTYAHFSDYSMFPDRFNQKSAKPMLISSSRSTEIVVPEHPGSSDENSHFSDFSLYPDKFNKILQNNENHQGGGGMSLPSPSKLISRYFEIL